MSGAGNTGRYGAVLREEQPRVEVDAQMASDAEAAGRVTLAHGRFRLSLPSAVVLAGLTCLGGYLASSARREADDPRPILEEFRNESQAATAARAHELDGINQRLGALEAKIGAVQTGIDSTSKRIDDLRADVHATQVSQLGMSMSSALRGH